MTDGDNDDDADDTYSSVKQALKRIQGGSKKVSCRHSTTAYFFEPPCRNKVVTWLKLLTLRAHI